MLLLRSWSERITQKRPYVQPYNSDNTYFNFEQMHICCTSQSCLRSGMWWPDAVRDWWLFYSPNRVHVQGRVDFFVVFPIRLCATYFNLIFVLFCFLLVRTALGTVARWDWWASTGIWTRVLLWGRSGWRMVWLRYVHGSSSLDDSRRKNISPGAVQGVWKWNSKCHKNWAARQDTC